MNSFHCPRFIRILRSRCEFFLEFTWARSILLFVFVIAISIASSSVAWKEYHNEQYNFSMNFPEEWSIKDGLTRVAMIAIRPYKSLDEVPENVNVIVKDLGKKEDLDNFYQENLKIMRSKMDDFREFQSGQETVHGIEAQWLVYSGAYQGTAMKNLLFLLIKGDRLYAITCSAHVNTFARYYPVFQKIGASFRTN